MPINIENLSSTIFKVLKGAGKSVKVYGENGEAVVDPNKGRRFFASPENFMVELSNNTNTLLLTLYLSNSVDMENLSIQKINNTLKSISTKNNVEYTITQFGHEIKPKDHAYKIKQKNESHRRATMANTLGEGKSPTMTGSRKRSTQKWNEARLVIKHTKPVNEESRGARTRNISKIFIETTEGERFKFPNTHLASARAMARHVGAGGTFHDNVGQHIVGLSEEFNAMMHVSAHVQHNRKSLSENAFTVRNIIRSRMKSIRESLNQFMTISGYKRKLTEVEILEVTPLNEEAISETLVTLRTDLNVAEEDSKMMAALGHVAVLEDIASEIVGRSQAGHRDVNAHFASGEDLEDKTKMDIGAAQERNADTESAAAAELLQSGNFEWMPPTKSGNNAKAVAFDHSPLSLLQWRIGSMSERLKGNVSGQNVLSLILSDIYQKIDIASDKAVDGYLPAGAINLTPGEQKIAEIFLKIAPEIGESLEEAGYNDWTPHKIVETEAVDDTIEESTYQEAVQLEEWFATFDPDFIFEDEESDEESDEENVKETEVTKMVNKGLIETTAFNIAARISNGERTIKEAKENFTPDEYESIVASLKENFRNAEELLESQEGDNRHPFKEENLNEFNRYLKSFLNRTKGKTLSQKSKEYIQKQLDNDVTIDRIAGEFGIGIRALQDMMHGAGLITDDVDIPYNKSKVFKKEISAKTKKGKKNAADIRATKDELDTEEYYW